MYVYGIKCMFMTGFRNKVYQGNNYQGIFNDMTKVT